MAIYHRPMPGAHQTPTWMQLATMTRRVDARDRGAMHVMATQCLRKKSSQVADSRFPPSCLAEALDMLARPSEWVSPLRKRKQPVRNQLYLTRPGGRWAPGIRLLCRSVLPAAILSGLLGTIPAAAEDTNVAADRSRVVTLWVRGGSEVKAAAESALTGSDEDVRQFLSHGVDLASYADDRIAAARMASVAGPNLRTAIRKALDNGSSEELRKFLNDGWQDPLEADQRVQVAQAADGAGPAMKEAAKAALNGSADDLEKFLEQTQYTAQEADERMRAAQLLDGGGPATKEAAKVALRGSALDIREFLNVGQYIARSRDQERASIAELAQQAEEAGQVAKRQTDAAKEASDRAVKASELAKQDAKRAADETRAAGKDSARAASAARQAAWAARGAASAAQDAISAAQAANYAARMASEAAANAAAAATGAAEAAARAQNAAANAAVDADGAAAAREAADNAKLAADAATRSSQAAKQVAIASRAAQEAAGAAASASAEADVAAGAADEAGALAGEASSEAHQARQWASTAHARAAESARAARRAQALAGEAASAADTAAEAADSASRHARNAAKAAEDAAQHAGESVTAAKQSTEHSKAAKESADLASDAVGKAKNVFDIARKVEEEELKSRTAIRVEQARALRLEDEHRKDALATATKERKALDEEAARLLADAAKPGADVREIAAKGRKVAVQAMKARGPWSQAAAKLALSGNDDAVIEYVRVRWQEAAQEDERETVRLLVAESRLEAVKAAAKEALKGDAKAISQFLANGQHEAALGDYRIRVAQINDGAGQEVKKAARTAMRDGSADKLREFLNTTQYTAREADERQQAAQIFDKGGPETKAAAKVALESPPEVLHDFIQIGQYSTARLDHLTATHISAVQQLISQAAATAATAQKNAAEAAIVAAKANKAAQEAIDAANQAKASAGEADKYAIEAREYAKQAAESAAQAAASAQVATNAAADAANSAQAAEIYAAQAEESASWARDSADSATVAAASARDSARQAHESAEAVEAALKETKDRFYELVYDEYLTDLMKEAQKELSDQQQATSKEITGALQSISVEEQARDDEGNICSSAWGVLDPRCYNGLLGFDLEMLGAKDLADCVVDGKKVSCLLALPWGRVFKAGKWAYKGSKFLTKKETKRIVERDRLLEDCKCFLVGTKVLMGNRSTKSIEDIEQGDTVLATDPITGATEPRRVTRQIVTEDDKYFNELTLDTADGSKKLVATYEHPFWSPSAHAWTKASALKPGSTLLSDDGTVVRVQANRSFEQRARTYNLTVEGIHTFYVLAGNTPVLVHNSNCPLKKRLSDKLPKGMTPNIAKAYDEYKAGRLTSHDVYSGREYPKWKDAKEYAVPGSPNNERILVKTLPNGVEIIGWTATHYKKIQRFEAPHFPDYGWK